MKTPWTSKDKKFQVQWARSVLDFKEGASKDQIIARVKSMNKPNDDEYNMRLDQAATILLLERAQVSTS